MRGVLHGAMAIYLARYLNVPPARLPGEAGDRLDDLPGTGEDIRAALLDAFDRQRQVDQAGRFVDQYRLDADHLARHGLYDPASEHDACGVGFVAATIGALSAMTRMPYYPIWSVMLIIFDVFVIWAAILHGRDIVNE